jgi:hypothetical protein
MTTECPLPDSPTKLMPSLNLIFVFMILYQCIRSCAPLPRELARLDRNGQKRLSSKTLLKTPETGKNR